METIHENVNQARKCVPFLEAAAENRKLLDTEEYLACCEYLKESERELLFGEIVLFLVRDVKEKVTDTYFRLIWPAACVLKPFFDLYVWEVTDTMIEDLFREKEVSTNRQRFAWHWIRWARKSDFNTHRAESEYGIHVRPPCAYREKKNRAFVESIHFPENYRLSRYVRFSTVFKYWVWLHKDDYSESYIQDTMCTAYKHMELLHDMPYRKVRADDVRRCMTGLSQSSRNAVIGLFHAMDMLAYEQDVIPQRYSKQLKSIKTVHAHENKFSEEEVKTLRQHTGEIEVDMTLVLLYTGLTAQEICKLTADQIDDGYLHISRDRTPYAARDIPLHPAIASSLTHVVSYLQERNAADARSVRKRMGVYWMVDKATAMYCREKHSPRDCRTSFAARLKEMGASDPIVEYLHGTTESFLKAYQRAYAHPSPDRIREAVLSLK